MSQPAPITETEIAEAMQQLYGCNVGVLIDFDSIGCGLPAGHEGQHHARLEGGEILWSFAPRPWVNETETTP
jgi:hypothetical protein